MVCEIRTIEGQFITEYFYCNTVDVAFGVIMNEGEGVRFSDFLERDPRSYDDEELYKKYLEFKNEGF